MGNTMHKGDGLSVAEISVAEESFSVGISSYQSRTTEDDNTAYSRPESYYNGRTNNDYRKSPSQRSPPREDRRSRPSQPTSSNSKSRHTSSHKGSSNGNRNWNNDGNREANDDREYSREENTGASRSDDNSSAYHHGYQMNMRSHESRDDERDYRNERSPRHGTTASQRRDYISLAVSKNSSKHSKHRDVGRTGSPANSRRATGTTSKNSSSHHERYASPHRNATSPTAYNKQQQRKKVPPTREESFGINTVADIAPADSDMAFYNGSLDESEAPDKDEEKTLRPYPTSPGSAKDDKIARAMINQDRDGLDDTSESPDEPSTTSSSVLESLPLVEVEHHREEEEICLELEHDRREEELMKSQSMQSGSSFSTMTKTVFTVAPRVQEVKQEPKLQELKPKPKPEKPKSQESQKSQKSQNSQKPKPREVKPQEVTPTPKLQEPKQDPPQDPPRDPPQTQLDSCEGDAISKMQHCFGSKMKPIRVMEIDGDEDMRNPAQEKLKDLMKQQQLQEEKLHQQLEQLRIQKEKLQQMQGEKNRPIPNTPGDDDDEDEEVQVIRNDPPVRNSQESNTLPNVYREQDIINRLEHARLRSAEKSGPIPVDTECVDMNDPDDAPLIISLLDEGVNAKYAGQEENTVVMINDDTDEATGTATGEMETLATEFEDVPAQCKLNSAAPSVFKESDLTTLSASYTEGGEPHVDQENLVDDDQLGALSQVMSSMDEDIDLEFVAKYDRAFNAFLDSHPSHFDRDSELVNNLKVAKLQRILEVSYQTECDLEAHLENTGDIEVKLDQECQQKLKTASSRKAARSIQLQSDLNHVKKQSKAMEGKMTMDVVSTAIKRAKRVHTIKTDLKTKVMRSRESLISALPDEEMKEIIETIEITGLQKGYTAEEKKRCLQQCQVDNAILNAEVKVLEKNITSLRQAAKKQAWVDAVLLRMDDRKMKKLKGRFEKKLGVSF